MLILELKTWCLDRSDNFLLIHIWDLQIKIVWLMQLTHEGIVLWCLKCVYFSQKIGNSLNARFGCFFIYFIFYFLYLSVCLLTPRPGFGVAQFKRLGLFDPLFSPLRRVPPNGCVLWLFLRHKSTREIVAPPTLKTRISSEMNLVSRITQYFPELTLKWTCAPPVGGATKWLGTRLIVGFLM